MRNTEAGLLLEKNKTVSQALLLQGFIYYYHEGQTYSVILGGDDEKKNFSHTCKLIKKNTVISD